jgi:hypothetical protein
MDQHVHDVIFQTFSEVFETMFFTFLDPVPELPTREDAAIPGQYIEASISYSGGCRGDFRFYFPLGLARNITVNFLGVNDDEVTDSQIRDSAAETANMAIGGLLGKLDPMGTASLTIPGVRQLADFSPASLLEQEGLTLFSTEFGLLWVVGSHE